MTKDQDRTIRKGGKVILFPGSGRKVDRMTGKIICIPCAVAAGDFKERAPASSGGSFDGGGNRAWINGRSFELVYHACSKVVCMLCGGEVPVAYVPEEHGPEDRRIA